MSQPQPFVRSYSFSNAFAAAPTMTFPGNSLDAELNDAKATLDQVLQNLTLLQNDDGSVLNGCIGPNQLSSALQIGFTVPTVWAPNASYVASPAATVFVNNKFYSCITSHTSSLAFATDLATGKWVLIADLAGIPLVTANQIAITPAGGVVTADVQSAVYGLDTRIVSLIANLVAASITDSGALGRSLLQSTSADAVLLLLNSWSTGDLKPTFKTAADTGWLMLDDTTFGDASSGATHTSASYQALFGVLFVNVADADAPVLTSAGGATTRGAQTNAATAWAAHCRMTLPKALGAAFGGAGAGSGLTSRALGVRAGAETVTVAQANLPAVNLSSAALIATLTGVTGSGSSSAPLGAGFNAVSTNNSPGTVAITGTVPLGGSGIALSIEQPTLFVNWMIKL